MVRNNLLALAFLVAGAALVWTVDRSMDRSELEEMRLITQITGEQLQLRLETCIAPRLSLMNRLTDGWDSWPDVADNWQRVADSTFGILPGVQALNLVDMSRTIRQVYPFDGNQQALGADLRQHPDPNVDVTLTLAEESGLLQRTTTLELLQSGAGFAIYKQIRSAAGADLGFVNGVFRVEDLLATCFSEQNLRDRFIYRIFEDDGRQIFASTGDSSDAAWRLSTQNEVDVAGRPWILELAPSQPQFRAISSLTENLWLTLGMLLVLLLALVIRALLNNRDYLEDSQARYRLLVENQSDLIIKLGPSGELLYASPSFCRFIGKTEEECLRDNFLDLVHPNDLNAIRKAFFPYSPQRSHPASTQRARLTSAARWTEWSSSTVFNDRQEIDCVVAVGRDITEQKSMEAQVAHSQKMRAVGEMAGGISHDFNNLLQVILANIELLLNSGGRGDQDTRLGNVRNAVNSGIELTQRLSTLSRQDSLSVESLNLNQLLSESTNLIARSLPANIKLNFSASDGPLQVKGNRSQLERVIFNLCFNARDAISGDGCIAVQLSATTLDTDVNSSHPGLGEGDYVLIQVSDDGCGIDEATLSRIFEPFFTTKRKEQGSGLGLANCYSIVSQHGGIITVDSTPDQGTRFEIYLPLQPQEQPTGQQPGTATAQTAAEQREFQDQAQQAPDRKEQRQDPASAPGKDPQQLRDLARQQVMEQTSSGVTKPVVEISQKQASGHPHILVVDDNDDLLQTIRSFLELEDFVVSICSDGLEAIELFRSKRAGFDLVILDLVMPEISGQEAASRIRKLLPDLPILFISGYIPERDQAAGMGREHLLRKPFTRKELLAAVGLALGDET